MAPHDTGSAQGGETKRYNSRSVPMPTPHPSSPWRRRAPALALLALLLPGVRWAAGEAPDREEEPVKSEHVEQVEVPARRGGDPEAPVGMASTVVDPEKEPVLSDGVAGLAATVAGVAKNGQGGLFQSISIRGAARQRILQMVDSVRITGDRRAGAAVSFLDPLLIGSLDVLRGPASAAYGPGALGGVLEVLPRHFQGPVFTGGFSGEGNTTILRAAGGNENFSVGVARREADNGETATGATRNSAFRQWSAVVSGRWGIGPRQYRFTWVPSLAEDIGKPNTDFPERTTIYPEERHQLVRFVVAGDGGWEGSAWLHAQSLDTRVTESDGARASITQESVDLGSRWRQEKAVGHGVSLRWGVETFHRRNVDATERLEPTGGGTPLTQRTLDNAATDEVNLFVSAGGKREHIHWETGGRFTWLQQRNEGAADVNHAAGSGFAGIVVPLAARLSFKGHAGSGWRYATLSERFFTGTTGRGSVLGNPDLDPERSFALEAGLQWLGRHVLISGSLFRTRISDFIERVEIAPDLLTFVNLTSGTLVGVETEGNWHGETGWHAIWGGQIVEGRDKDDRALADVSPDELFAGVGRDRQRWGFDTRLTWRAEKNDPGSSEKAIGSATLLSASAFFRPAPAWRLELRAVNLLDEAYFPAADTKAQEAPGRTFGIFLTWSGG
ncbi:MAG: TonB-dependent receptor [Acidobacteria bacterium]|nr:MAG: TonB-dependent receptor [Acidobacteriota bacterium]